MHIQNQSQLVLVIGKNTSSPLMQKDKDSIHTSPDSHGLSGTIGIPLSHCEALLLAFFTMLFSQCVGRTRESPFLCSGKNQGLQVTTIWLTGQQLENSAALISSSHSFAPASLLGSCCVQQFFAFAEESVTATEKCQGSCRDLCVGN